MIIKKFQFQSMIVIKAIFFPSLHVLIHITVSSFVLCVGAWTSGVDIAVLRLLSSLNVEFYRDWRGQRPQFKFVYYLWPN